jgi:ABC-type antimicrobial peptide transport system permease subunit
MQLKAKRNLLVAFGGSIGIFSVLLMLSLGNGVTGYMNDEINSNMNPLLIDVVKSPEEEDQSQHGPPGQQMGKEPFTKEDIAKISGIENVVKVEKGTTIRGNANVVYSETNYELSSLETITDSVNEDNIEMGILPSKNEILLTTDFAQNLISEETYETLVGESIKLFVNEMDEDNKPVIVEKTLVISGIYEQADRGPMGGASAYISYNTLEDVYSEQNLTLEPIQINAYAANLDDVEEIKMNIEQIGFVSSPTAKMMEQVTTYLNMATWLLSGIAGISLLVSGIMILVVLYISVVERTREIGILRAIGARKKDIRRIFFSESALMGLMSGVIAVAGAFLISIVLNNVLYNSFGAELILLTPEYMLFGIGISTLISVIAGLLPSSKAAKLDPMESLRYE